ncbi:MAG: exo-alpha-sialidase [Ruminococcaceae bacterium]|nr:exo-alpha-sialidase [Oscillospiraceae bacterium]
MKTFKSVMSVLLLLSFSFTALISCSSEDDEEIIGIDISGYTIVRQEAMNTAHVQDVVKLKKAILEHTGAELTVKSDWLGRNEVLDESGAEILIGKTNRSASIEALSELEEKDDSAYIIKVTGNKIVIIGKTGETLRKAIKIFINDYIMTSKGSNKLYIEDGHNELSNVNPDSIMFSNMTEFYVEYTTDLAVPRKGSKLSYSYETLIQLCHNGEHNGTLIASHAGLFGNSSDNGYKIYKSTDNGNTWKQISIAIDRTNAGLSDNTLQPCLYELPADMGEFKAGTLFLGGCSRGNSRLGDKYSAVTLYYSTDLGETWKSYYTLATGGSAESRTGVWEPFFIYEESTKRVYCFYSDETGEKSGKAAQKLVYRYTTDMKNWSDVGIAISCKEEDYRPGMISIAKMGNGEYYMTYEMCGLNGCPVYAKKTTKLDDWGDIADYGTRVMAGKKSMGSAPWCAWTPAGGECGTLVVVAHHMVDGGSSIYGTGTDMFLSFDYGETFVAIENPIPFRQLPNSKCGYSSFVGFSEDGSTMYYMNNPPCSDDENEEQAKVVFMRIKIW